MAKGGIKQWPADERPREKMQKLGCENLTDAELLALILRTGDHTSDQSAIDLGRSIIKKFKNLRSLSTAELSEICEIKGVGLAKAASILAALTMASRINTERLQILEKFNSPIQVYNHFHYRFRDRKKEHFIVLLLDAKNRIMKEVQVSEGSLSESIVHPREVFNPAIRESALAIILIHNHPSGDPSPSNEDKKITIRLKEAGTILGIKVLDHIIIGDGGSKPGYFSFVEGGLL
ncbi:MAG: DNA repair protein RadC [Desulfuromonadales bacterium]|nr:DNA repair protein RadC [Desulfuromonadales bacterium]